MNLGHRNGPRRGFTLLFGIGFALRLSGERVRGLRRFIISVPKSAHGALVLAGPYVHVQVRHTCNAARNENIYRKDRPIDLHTGTGQKKVRSTHILGPKVVLSSS